MALRCLLVDDDEISRRMLLELCSKVDELSVVQVCDQATSAIAYLRENPVDLVFLDIEMPGMTGLDMIRTLEHPPAIIITTSRKEYAAEAFDLPVIDYLEKPISLIRFLRAIERVHNNLVSRKSTDSEEVFVRHDGKLVRLPVKDIVYIESLGDYVVFNTQSMGKLIVHTTITHVEDMMRHRNMIRIHRSYMVNLESVSDIRETNLSVRGKILPVSRTYRPNLLNNIALI